MSALHDNGERLYDIYGHISFDDVADKLAGFRLENL